jgi:signal transduction histidine kinase
MMSRNAKHLSRMTLMLYDSSDTGISEEEQNISCNERISCNEVARECIANTIAFFPGTTVSFDTALPDDFCISSNRLYLVRTLRELIYNAAKYSDGTNITMTLSKTDTTVRFVVEDTGPGITDDYIEQIFTPFAKVNDLSEGLGLGLPLSKRHAINLGGDLTLDPDYREGCRFTLELPFSKH